MNQPIKPLICEHYDALVLANGRMPERASLIHLLQTCPLIICCDGAADNLGTLNVEPDVVIGDCDSLSSELLTRWQTRIVKSNDQETNDLTKAMRWLSKHMDRGNIAILGATGKRDDHTLGNLSLLSTYNDLKSSDWEVSILSDYGVYNTCKAPGATLESFPKQQVSIFMPRVDVRLSVSGLKYTIKDRVLQAWWEGTLNEAEADFFQVFLQQDHALVFRSYDPK